MLFERQVWASFWAWLEQNLKKPVKGEAGNGAADLHKEPAELRWGCVCFSTPAALKLYSSLEIRFSAVVDKRTNNPPCCSPTSIFKQVQQLIQRTISLLLGCFLKLLVQFSKVFLFGLVLYVILLVWVLVNRVLKHYLTIGLDGELEGRVSSQGHCSHNLVCTIFLAPDVSPFPPSDHLFLLSSSTASYPLLSPCQAHTNYINSNR